MSWFRRPFTRRQRALPWLVAAPLVVILSWYGAGYHLTPWGAGIQAMERAAVGKTKLLMDLGEVPTTEEKLEELNEKRRAYVRVNEKAMVFYTAYRLEEPPFTGWRNGTVFPLDVREGKCPFLATYTTVGTGTNWYELYYLFGQVNDPEIDHVELWWWKWDKNGETWGGPAVRIDHSEFLYRDGKRYLFWQGELSPYEYERRNDRLFLKCYSKENKLLHQERLDPVRFS